MLYNWMKNENAESSYVIFLDKVIDGMTPQPRLIKVPFGVISHPNTIFEWKQNIVFYQIRLWRDKSQDFRPLFFHQIVLISKCMKTLKTDKNVVTSQPWRSLLIHSGDWQPRLYPPPCGGTSSWRSILVQGGGGVWGGARHSPTEHQQIPPEMGSRYPLRNWAVLSLYYVFLGT